MFILTSLNEERNENMLRQGSTSGRMYNVCRH